MRIRILRRWKPGAKPGDVIEIADGVANMLIRQRKAEAVEGTPRADVRPAFAKAAMTAKPERKPDASPIPEAVPEPPAGRRSGGVKPRGKQAALAEAGAAD